MTAQQQDLPLTGLAARGSANHRGDHLLMAEMIGGGSKVLDVGCGEGDLLQLLEARGIDGRGIELSREGVNRCVSKGLAVVQGDADTDLVNYPDDAFDYVILSQTLQATRQPKAVLENLLRIGRRAIVSFPNFGFWKMRLQLLVGGHMPRTENLPATWYDTPNIHFCTIKDFVQLCDEINVKMERRGGARSLRPALTAQRAVWFWNMFGEQGVFLLSRAGKKPLGLVSRTRCGILHAAPQSRDRTKRRRSLWPRLCSAPLRKGCALRCVRARLHPHRPRIARSPAAGFRLYQKPFQRRVEQIRLFLVQHVAGLGKHRQP